MPPPLLLLLLLLLIYCSAPGIHHHNGSGVYYTYAEKFVQQLHRWFDYDQKMEWMDMRINVKKSHCLRIGPI